MIDISTSKTGKHGHAKCKFVAIDIFTGAKKEDMQPSSHNSEIPNVARKEFSLLDIDDEGFLSLKAGKRLLRVESEPMMSHLYKIRLRPVGNPEKAAALLDGAGWTRHGVRDIRRDANGAPLRFVFNRCKF